MSNCRLFHKCIFLRVLVMLGIGLTFFEAAGVRSFAATTATSAPATVLAATSAPVAVPSVTSAPATVPTVTPSPDATYGATPIPSATDSTANITPYTQTVGTFFPKELSTLKPYNDCFIVFGDSRTCSVASTVILDKTWKKIYVANNFPYCDIVATKADNLLIICGEAGGYFDNGAYTRAYSRFCKISENSPAVIGSINHYYCNLFGVNDVMIAKRNSTADYTKMNEAIRKGNGNADVFYQFTAGPISETGTAVLTNAEIENYNKNYKNTKNCVVIDLYSYLKSSGFDVVMNDADDTGIHYDSRTNYKILGLITSLSGKCVSTASPVSSGASTAALKGTSSPVPTVIPATTPITVATPIPVVTPAPVVPTAIPVVTP